MVPRDGALLKTTDTTHDAGPGEGREPMNESEEKREAGPDKEETKRRSQTPPKPSEPSPPAWVRPPSPARPPQPCAQLRASASPTLPRHLNIFVLQANVDGAMSNDLGVSH